MFGRKNRDQEPREEIVAEREDLVEPDEDLAEEELADAPADDDRDEWDELDESRDWRDDGPFDITEVDLDDDDVPRVSFGPLVLTPSENMELQLQMNPETQEIQTALVMLAGSGLEIALFAAPASGGMARDVRREVLTSTRAEGGHAELAPGPFGTEIRRMVQVQMEDGQEGTHISRTWLAEGPRWLLRGVLMGEACLDETDQGPALPFVEFFKNIVVVRGDRPRPAGDVIPMTLPDELAQAVPGPQA